MTERRLDKNPELKKKYHSAMEEYFNEGYAEKIEKPITEEGWYWCRPVWAYYHKSKIQRWSMRKEVWHIIYLSPDKSHLH